MLSEKLKEQTMAHHQQLEKKLVGKMKSVNSKEDYISLLQLFYSYFGGLEERINLFVGNEQLPDFEQRRKTNALEEDIRILGGHPVDKAHGNDLPVIDNIASAFGALYVIEGSTLGGSIISKMITARTGLQNGFSFFNGYGDNGMQMWAVFKTVLNKLPELEDKTVIKTANDTFLAFENWINKTDNHAG